MSPSPATLTIGDLSARSGVSEGTLRVWESRHGFPVPERLPSGHRRYSEEDLAGVIAIRQAREAGLSLSVAIARARQGTAPARSGSLFVSLRDRFSHLHSEVMDRPSLLALTRAVEDECASRSVRPLFFGCFQQERHFRAAEARWRDMAVTAERSVVLADFPEACVRPGAPAEIPLGANDPLNREWAVVCVAAELSVCLVAWERPGRPRRFETLWCLEPEVAHEAARLLSGAVGRHDTTLAASLNERLAGLPAPAAERQLRLSAAVATRAVAYARQSAADVASG